VQFNLKPLSADNARATTCLTRYTDNAIPDAFQQTPPARKQFDQLCRASQVIAKPTLGGLHHEYRWETVA
jgi:hypothetical protein